MPNFSGIWNLKEQLQGIAAGRWTGIVSADIFAAGRNSNGTLGDGTTVYRSSPVQAGGNSSWADVSSRNLHTLALQLDGTLWAWGWGGSGQLGQNSTISLSSPTQVGALTSWSKISAGGTHSMAVKTDGTLWAWGRNTEGRLGVNDVVDRSSPVQVGALTTWADVSSGDRQTLAVTTSGALYAWGNNAEGQLGLGDAGLSTHRSSPVQVGALTTWTTINIGHAHTFAIKTDGTLWAWGDNRVGQLGTNNLVYYSSPVQVGADTNWLRAAATIAAPASVGFSVAVKTDGTLWSWGHDGGGKLGQGTNYVNRSSPTQIGALTNWSEANNGKNSSIASKTDGTLWTWGRNNYGELMQGDKVAKSSPTQVGVETYWTKTTSGQTQAAIASSST